ncbi:MAG: tRNA dihydrouridine synthase [Desulfovibrionales bacterium]
MNQFISPDYPWLAPLAGFSDLPFRLLCRRFGCRVACTEMISAKGLVFGSSGTADLLRTCPGDTPLVVQLFGSEPEYLEKAVVRLRESGFTHFDLNAGCSVKKVVRTGSGAALLKDPDRLVACASSLIRHCAPGHVGVKFRLGWTEGQDRSIVIGQMLQDAGVGWLTLHPRTAQQKFSGSARWDGLKQLKAHVSIPVIGSGDLFTAEDGLACLRATGIDSIMFARGALRDPAIFSRYHALQKGMEPPTKTPDMVAEIIRSHVTLCREHGDERTALLKMRTVVPRYLRDLPGAKALRQRFTLCSSWEEFETLLWSLERMTLGETPCTGDNFEVDACQNVTHKS